MILTENWLERARKYIPNGCQTLSKCPERYVNGVYPKFLTQGHGCMVYGEDGQMYTDYISSLGAILYGYSYLPIDEAVKETITQGRVLLSLPHPKEGKLAEQLCTLTGYQKAKFFKTGSEATSAAVRVARAYTGRDSILMCGYNGWHDWAATTYTRNAGIPRGSAVKTARFDYNDLGSFERCLQAMKPVAAVILEPLIFEAPKDDFLKKLVKMAHDSGALVIFDEIVNGLRFGPRGSGGFLGVEADLVCMGKSLGNGYPIAALLGSHAMDVFEKDDFIASGTFSGDLIGISAALAVLERFEGVSAKLMNTGTVLKIGFNSIASDLGIEAECVGFGPRTTFRFPDPLHKALFWQECVRRGVLLGYANFVTVSHGPQIISQTLNVIEDALKIVKKNWVNTHHALEGDLPQAAM